MSQPLDPFRLDRELRRLTRRWVRWRRQLRSGDALEDDPFDADWGCGKSAFDTVSDWPESDPLREPLRRWVFRLAEQRINRPVIAQVTYEWLSRKHPITRPIEAQLTLSEMLSEGMRAPSRAEAWLAALSQHGEHLVSVRGLLWERRREVAVRMGLESLDGLENCSPLSGQLAAAWLEDTREAMLSLGLESPQQYFERALGLAAADGWPGRLTLRHLTAWLDEAELFRSVTMDPGKLPAAVGPASFLRGLARVGTCWSDALAPQDQPFVIAHEPWGLRRLLHGSLFGSIPLEPTFLQRSLGVSRDRLLDVRRALGAAMLLESRAAALRLLMREAALQGRQRARQKFEELGQRQLGMWTSELPALCLFAPREDAEQRFVALLLAAGEARRLKESHDEDWWRNPRAIEELRAMAQRPPQANAAEAPLRNGAETLRRELFEALQ